MTREAPIVNPTQLIVDHIKANLNSMSPDEAIRAGHLFVAIDRTLGSNATYDAINELKGWMADELVKFGHAICDKLSEDLYVKITDHLDVRDMANEKMMPAAGVRTGRWTAADMQMAGIPLGTSYDGVDLDRPHGEAVNSLTGMTVQEEEEKDAWVSHTFKLYVDAIKQMQVVREKNTSLEVRRNEMIDSMRKVHAMQASDGNWNANEYNLGYFNGIELMMAIADKRNCSFRILTPDMKQANDDDAFARGYEQHKRDMWKQEADEREGRKRNEQMHNKFLRALVRGASGQNVMITYRHGEESGKRTVEVRVRYLQGAMLGDAPVHMLVGTNILNGNEIRFKTTDIVDISDIA